MTEARYGQCDGWTLDHLANGHHYPSIGEFALQRAARELARDLIAAEAKTAELEAMIARVRALERFDDGRGCHVVLDHQLEAALRDK